MTLYDTSAHMSCMSYSCYIKLKDPQPLQNVSALSVPSATGLDLCPIHLTCCGIMLGGIYNIFIIFACENLQNIHNCTRYATTTSVGLSLE